MKIFLIAFIAPILTFAIGVGIYRISVPNVSLETISEHTVFYDGMNVEIETYVQLTHFDENEWYLGEPFEKKQIFTWLKIGTSNPKIDKLHNELKEGLSETYFKRAKVLVKGKIKDNCKSNELTITCCFGKSLTITAQEVNQLAPIENYTIPK
jgi:hypothetical protein